jgi:hypothetical protein
MRLCIKVEKKFNTTRLNGALGVRKLFVDTQTNLTVLKSMVLHWELINLKRGAG